MEGQALKDTHEQREAPALTGETKVCATSLKSILEFAILGTESSYDILKTSYPTVSSAPLQTYTVFGVSEDIYAPCHPLLYPYAVFFCHYIGTGSKIFKVLLGGENGNKMEALGICHLDTSEWTPEHVIFRQLGTRRLQFAMSSLLNILCGFPCLPKPPCEKGLSSVIQSHHVYQEAHSFIIPKGQARLFDTVTPRVKPPDKQRSMEHIAIQVHILSPL